MSLANEVIEPVAAVGRRYHLDDFHLNHEQMATLVLPDGLTLTVEYAAEPLGRVFLMGELDRIPEGAFEAVATALLAINGRWLDTAGASFAMHPHSDRVIVLLPVPAAALDAQVLPDIVDDFLARCRNWSDKINRGETDLSAREEIEGQIDALPVAG